MVEPASQDLREGMVKKESLDWQVCLELMDDQEQRVSRVSQECPEEQASRVIEDFLGLLVLMDGLVELALLG